MYNYAEDNTLSKSDKTLEKVISALEEDSNSLINWILKICVLKLSLKSMVTPSNFTSSSQDKFIPFKLNITFLSCVFLPTEMA
jgi:hypothetical protein